MKRWLLLFLLFARNVTAQETLGGNEYIYSINTEADVNYEVLPDSLEIGTAAGVGGAMLLDGDNWVMNQKIEELEQGEIFFDSNTNDPSNKAMAQVWDYLGTEAKTNGYFGGTGTNIMKIVLDVNIGERMKDNLSEILEHDDQMIQIPIGALLGAFNSILDLVGKHFDYDHIFASDGVVTIRNERLRIDLKKVEESFPLSNSLKWLFALATIVYCIREIMIILRGT